MRHTARRLTTLAGLALAALVAAGVVPSDAALERARAPRFKVKDLSGKTLDLDKLLKRGPVLLDFWATWCKPCHAAIPELQAWHEAYGERGLTIVGVSVDGPRNHGKVRPFVQRMGIGYPVAIDQDGRLQHLYQAQALPTAILIGRDGAIVSTRVGYRRGESARYEEKIRAALGLEAGAEGEERPSAPVSMPAPESAFDTLRTPPPVSDSLAAPGRQRESRAGREGGGRF